MLPTVILSLSKNVPQLRINSSKNLGGEENGTGNITQEVFYFASGGCIIEVVYKLSS
jgi:hypothetical protein